jgi:hypothetical protein
MAREVQSALNRLGLLDGPPDGLFGPVSNWALDVFISKHFPGTNRFDNRVAAALLESDPWPLKPQSDYAGQVVRRMLEFGYFINRHPDCVNIVYIEGMYPDGTLSGNKPNHFDDTRMILRLDSDGVPRAEAWEATTEPGRLYTDNPMGELEGAARIAFNQFKAWSVGFHGTKESSRHESLLQVRSVDFFRDKNRDFRRIGDSAYSGTIGLNQHGGYNYSKEDIRNASAGCLVGRDMDGHRAFMELVKSDARHRVSGNYIFLTTILDGSELPT